MINDQSRFMTVEPPSEGNVSSSNFLTTSKPNLVIKDGDSHRSASDVAKDSIQPSRFLAPLNPISARAPGGFNTDELDLGSNLNNISAATLATPGLTITHTPESMQTIQTKSRFLLTQENEKDQVGDDEDDAFAVLNKGGKIKKAKHF